MRGGLERWEIPTPFPVGPVNAYHLPGRKPALVDAGPRTPEAEQALLARLEGVRVEVLVVTHEHVDHAGLAGVLERRGVEVWVHREAERPLREWVSGAQAREADYERGLVAAAVPAAHVERMRYGGRTYDAWAEPVHAARTFQGGDRLELGDGTWEVVDAPGHTRGSYLLTDGARTFSGDTLLERITPNAVSVRDSERGALVAYLATLRKLRRRDWGEVLPGHGRPFTGATEIIDRALRHAEVRQARILRELSGHRLTAWAVVERLFPRLPENQMFLAVSEVLGHLEQLRVEGKAEVRRSGGVDSYARVDEGKA